MKKDLVSERKGNKFSAGDLILAWKNLGLVLGIDEVDDYYIFWITDLGSPAKRLAYQTKRFIEEDYRKVERKQDV